MQIISYGHFYDGSLINGTLSDLDGVPRATWTLEVDGQKVRREQPLTPETFRQLWTDLTRLSVFLRHQVRDPDRPLDPHGEHVIWVASGENPEADRAMFAVPAGEADPAFLAWLSRLNVPRAGQPMGGAARGGAFVERERVYVNAFGHKFSIQPDAVANEWPIDVYSFHPGSGGDGHARDFFTLVTSGLSAMRMRVPEQVTFKRYELVLYVDEVNPEHLNLLSWLAKLPYQQATTWYSFETTMTNGTPPQPVFEGSPLDCFMFLDTIQLDDTNLHERLVIEGDPTPLLWVVPITSAECRFKIDRGSAAFMQVLDKNRHDLVLHENRRCYVASQGGKPWWKPW